jgi:transcriptional regulator with XRE-family HTH domain
MKSDNINQDLGFNLKAARSDKAWSLDVCSARTGVSKAMLGQIERGESSPTIARLWKIANGFELPLSYFLAKHSPMAPAIAVPVSTSEQDISFVTLFPFDSATAMEVFEITLACQHQHISEPHNDGVVEHIIVIKGAMEYFIDGGWHPLPQGATVKFNACQQHGYRNMTSQPAVFHNIICYG